MRTGRATIIYPGESDGRHPHQVVASAWGRQIQLDDADDERLDQFIRRFRLGPEALEPGASCAGGNAATL